MCTHRASIVGAAFAMLALGAGACSSREGAEQQLVASGYTDIVLSPSGNGFVFHARLGDRLCTGTTEAYRGLVRSHYGVTTRCMPAPSPPPQPAAATATARASASVHVSSSSGP